MCGIAGMYYWDGHVVDIDLMRRMLDEIKHRGPDNVDYYISDNVAIGHRLLKIQELTNKAFQPAIGKKYVISYNGEIYNYQVLREQLKRVGIKFQSSGDTEVLLMCFETWGIERTLEIIDGCFAISLFDKSDRSLYLIRDRVGIKPLYYYYDSEKLLFGSEIKSILKDESIKRRFNISTILLAFSCRLWMPHKETMFENIRMMEQGTYLHLSIDGKLDVKHYFEYKYDDSETYTNEYLMSQVSESLKDSIINKLLAKVPIAAFLSGGIDSSLICKILNDNSNERLNTYTVRYENEDDPDYLCAKMLAEKERFIQHYTVIAPEDYSISKIDDVIYHVEELLIDKVYLSVYENYRHARKDGFTVVLNGQGADECWLGYLNNWHIFDYSEIDEKDIVIELINNYYKRDLMFKDKLKDEVFNKIVSNLEEYLNINMLKYSSEKLLNKMQIMSMRTILHDLLMQEDKLAMAHSIESRVPFVDDNNMVMLALSINANMKILDGREKYILRYVGKDILPEKIIKREKMPFQEPPDKYDNHISKIYEVNFKKIKSSKIVNYLFKSDYIKCSSNSSDKEKWWLINLWRFEELFKMEV